MSTYIVERVNGTVEVAIFKHKNKDKYSFINLTKKHICPCEFNSIEEALNDMDKLIKQGKIIRYYKENEQYDM